MKGKEHNVSLTLVEIAYLDQALRGLIMSLEECRPDTFERCKNDLIPLTYKMSALRRRCEIAEEKGDEK